jgi:hypothetical protein
MELVRKTTRNRLVTSHLPSKVSIEGSCSLLRSANGRRQRQTQEGAFVVVCTTLGSCSWLCSRALEPGQVPKPDSAVDPEPSNLFTKRDFPRPCTQPLHKTRVASEALPQFAR